MKKSLALFTLLGFLSVSNLANAASTFGKAEIDLGTALSAEIDAVQDDDVYFTKALSAIRAFDRGLSYAKQGYNYDLKADEYDQLANRYEDEGDFLKALNADRLAVQSEGLARYYYNLAYASFNGADVYFKKGDFKKKLKVIIKNAAKARAGK